MIDTILPRLNARKAHVAALLAVLVGMFVLTGVLAFTAHRTHEEAVDRSNAQLHDLAAQAAATWASNARQLLLKYASANTFNNARALIPYAEGQPLPRLDTVRTLLDGTCGGCLDTAYVRALFAVDFRSGAVESLGPLPLGFAERAVELGFSTNELTDARWGVGYHVATSRGTEYLAAFLMRLDADSLPFSGLGIIAHPRALERPFRGAAAAPILDSDIVGDLSNDELFVFSVTGEDGTPIFATTGEESGFAAIDTIPDFMPGATARVAIRAGMESELIAGGLPKSPLPVILGLLLMNGTLVVLAFLLLRREEEVSRLRADFIAGVSHELRTPLAQIRMFAETLMLGRTRTDKERMRSLEIIDQEARRLTMLVENVLLYARTERHKARVNPVPADVAVDVREAVQGFAILHRSKPLEVRTELQENVIAHVDRGALKQMLLNLLDNAAKYGPPEQRITVGLALFGSHLRLWVDDEGPGVPKSERARVFEAFYRLNRDQESPVAGSGLGLSLVRELAALHHGRVWIDDAPGGGGARVVVELPEAHLRPDPVPDPWAIV